MSWPLSRLRPGAPRRRAADSTLFGASSLTPEPGRRRAGRRSARYAVAGALCGAVAGVIAFAPAGWLAGAVARWTGERILLADALGTVWNGSAVLVLTGGPGSRDAAALPGRVEWTLGLKGLGFQLRARQACCLPAPVDIGIRPGIGRLAFDLPAAPAGLGEWPAGWLAGLGTPWNTLQLGGSMRLAMPGAARVEYVQGRWIVDGEARLDLAHLSSRIVTLDELGSYRVVLAGSAATPPALSVTTTDGVLRLSGQGQWAGPALRFRGEAVAAEGSEAALNNLLNIIGRRQGARSVISIG